MKDTTCATCNGLGTIPNPRDYELNVRATCYACGGNGKAPYPELTLGGWTREHCDACGWAYVDCRDCRFNVLRIKGE